MRKIYLLAMAMIVIALGAGATIQSHTSAGSLAAPQQAVPILQPASMADSATMPILVPAEAIDPTADYFVRTGDLSNASSIRP